MPKQLHGPPPDSRLELHGEEEKEFLKSLGYDDDLMDFLIATRADARRNREKKLMYQRERRRKQRETETVAQKEALRAARRYSQAAYRELNRDYLRVKEAERRARLKSCSILSPTVWTLPRRSKACIKQACEKSKSPSFDSLRSMSSAIIWPSTPLPPFQRPAHWPSHIDHQNIYLTGEAERRAILQTIEIDEGVSSEAVEAYVDGFVAERDEYRRRMAEIRPTIETKIRNEIFMHVQRASRANGWPITEATLSKIRLVAYEQAEYVIHLTLREEDATARVSDEASQRWVDID
ncbi:hypothetical protein C8R42DRAFT_637501 [Lentinula raphanica]|nr:hypothetical protein C8R42DRAFT_637501 [Lentinula raphanica]